ncbi:MAG: hypothetical protein NVS2B16_36350 [Chloroflexota bacterium]
MIRPFLAIALLTGLFLTTATAHAAPLHIHWTQCTITTDHAGAGAMKRCTHYAMPRAPRARTGTWKQCTTPAQHMTVCVTYPTFVVAPKTIPKTIPVAPAGKGGYPMLVTYYLATGSPMANGIMPSIGWAACGYDLPLNTRVYVPGIGALTCGDRIGFQPYQHIDVFGIPLATGYRFVSIL